MLNDHFLADTIWILLLISVKPQHIEMITCISKIIIKRHTFDNQISILVTLFKDNETWKEGHIQNVFDLKFNSLFLILLPFLFANIRIFISLVLLRIFLSSFSLCTVYQFSLKRLCVDFVVAWNHSTLHSLSLSPLISYSRLFYPLVRLILCYLPLLLSFVLRLVL